MNVFDRKAKRMQRDRTALLADYKVYEYVKEEVNSHCRVINSDKWDVMTYTSLPYKMYM